MPGCFDKRFLPRIPPHCAQRDHRRTGMRGEPCTPIWYLPFFPGAMRVHFRENHDPEAPLQQVFSLFDDCSVLFFPSCGRSQWDCSLPVPNRKTARASSSFLSTHTGWKDLLNARFPMPMMFGPYAGRCSRRCAPRRNAILYATDNAQQKQHQMRPAEVMR